MDLQSLLRAVDIDEPPAGRPAELRQRLHELRRRADSLEADLNEQAPVITGALLTATAFRLRDEAALITALRALVSAVAAFERSQAA
jgi:hypothetical protein